MKREDLEELKKFCTACKQCTLGARRMNLVFGDGNPDADVMFVGEAPGADEDRQGIPFVGSAGKLLTSLLKEIGISREEVYIANILKCRPPENRDPLPEEIAACKEYLSAQIAIIQPGVLCTLGRYAAITLLGLPDFKISRDHAKPVKWRGVTALPMYHPAAALHQPRNMEYLREDFRKLKEMLEHEGLLY